MALGAEEAEAHRTADQDLVGELEEALDHADLVGDLGAPEHDHQRPRGVVEDGGQLAHLALQQQARVGRQPVGDPLGRRVGPVRGPEGVVDVEVGELGQIIGEAGVVALLPRLEAGVLEQQHRSGAELGGRGGDLGADDGRRELDLGTEQLAEPPRHRRQRELRIASPRAPEMGAEDDLRAAVAEQLDRRQGRADPLVVADLPALERGVEVGADEDGPSRHVGVADGRLRESPARPRIGFCAHADQPGPVRGPCRRARPGGSSNPTRCRTRRPPSASCPP